MKQIQFYLTTYALLLAFSVQAQHFSFTPEKPAPGEKVKLVYHPGHSALEGHEAIEVTAYFFENNDAPSARSVDMAFKDGKFTGQVTTTSRTKAAAFSIGSADGKIYDDNDNTGFKFLCYQKDPIQPVAGAYAAKAMMYGTYNRFLHIDRNREKAFNLLKKEFKTHPSSKENPDYFGMYASLAKRLDDYDAMGDMKAELNKIMKEKKAGEERLAVGYGIAQTLEDEEEAATLKKRIAKRYPHSKVIQKDLYYQFREAESVTDKMGIFENYKEKFGGTIKGKSDLDYMASNLASHYAKQEDWGSYEKWGEQD